MKKMYTLMVVIIVVFMLPINIEAKQKPANDMKGLDLAKYRNSNIDEVKKIVKLKKDKKKKNRYYDKYKTTYITTDELGKIIKITIKGTSNKEKKYAPTFGGVALACDSVLVEFLIEEKEEFSIYENPTTKGDVREDEDEDYIIYAQEKDSYNTVTFKTQYLNSNHIEKKLYQISWKRDGVTSSNIEKYGYHDVDSEKALAQKEAEESAQRELEEQQNYIPTEMEEIQSSIDTANKVDFETLLRNSSQFDYTNICIEATLLVDGFYNNFYISGRGESIRVFPDKIVDLNGNPIEKLLEGDHVIIVGPFKYHDYYHEYFGETQSTIDYAIVILNN